MVSRSSTLVVVVAALTGVAAARVTLAAGDDPPGGVAPAVHAPAGSAQPPSVHDDSEPDEAHGVAGASAGDDGPPPRPLGLVRQVVPQEDGMLRMPGGKLVLSAGAAHGIPGMASMVVAPFWMDRTEVTVEAYRACVDSRACERPQKTSASCTFELGDGDLPVSCVRWRDADGYCRSAGKRLPSEVEWEYAARGNLPLQYPWGGGTSCTHAITLINDQSGRSCAARPARVATHPAGASLFGVQDMSGNVEEWTADWYAEVLAPGPAPRAGSAHVLRGGGWLSPPSLSRTTVRDWGSAVEAGANVGFRCARDDG